MALYANENGTLQSITGISGYDFKDIVSWSNGSDEDIKRMLAAADAGALDLSLFWSVGDERVITMDAMPATGVGESHPSQDVILVLLHRGGVTLTNNKTANWVVGLKECLATNGSIDSASSGIYIHWENCQRRTWCNNVFYNAIPSGIRSIFKPFKCISNIRNGIITTEEYFALPAEKEIFGKRIYCSQEEADALIQFDYYKTEANRIKHAGVSTDASAVQWWERSRYPNYAGGGASQFCRVGETGTGNQLMVTGSCGFAPFGAI